MNVLEPVEGAITSRLVGAGVSEVKMDGLSALEV